MWILESNGDFLQGKRMWLKPGKNYLFGRVKKDGVRFAIDHKTVSRKHFVISVEDVGEGDAGRLHARSKVTVIDQNSKSGTSVNSEILKGDGFLSRELKNNENSVRPGNCPHELVIRWQPCVLTFNLMKREMNTGVLQSKQDRVRGLDIKAIGDFIPDQTTHVVVNKRNTPKGLQALINGKHIVSDSFIDALEYATTPTNLDENENQSPLEQDFDNHWPQASDYLPPPGREPTRRPVESYEPSAARWNIFEGYTFVFGDQSQFDNLLPVITQGHGKALLFKIVNGETSVDEAVRYMQNVAGEKGFGESVQSGGPVMVRWSPKNEFDDWTANLINQAALQLGQRAIDQAEFLDAILGNDATVLRQTLPLESTAEGRVPPPPSLAGSFIASRHGTQKTGTQVDSRTSASSHTQTSGPQSNGTVQNSLPKNDISQAPGSSAETKSRFGKQPRYRLPASNIQKEFDDGFDPDAIVPYEDDEEASQHSQPDPDNSVKQEPVSASKKRRRSSSPDTYVDSFDEELDDLLPAATAMKRQKLATEAEARRRGVPVPVTVSTPAKPAPKRAKKKEKEIDVREVAKAQREKEIEEARKEREEFETLPYENDGKQPARLAVVVEMQLPVRQPRLSAKENPEDDPRWDPRWNGRKNFKKFRPQGERAVRRAGHSTKVFVPLIEIKRSTGGLGDRYWTKTQEEKEHDKKKKSKSRRTQSQSQSQTVRSTLSVELDDDNREMDDMQPSPEATRLQQEAAEILQHEVDPDSPRTTRASDRAQSQSQAHGSKRAAASQGGGRAKKQKTLPVTVVNENGSDNEDDSDDMKFKFGRRGKRGKAN